MQIEYNANYNLCDDILKSLANDITIPNVDIRSKLSEPLNQLDEVVSILEGNGHIRRNHLPNSPYILRITQKGIDFYKAGGYKSYLQLQMLQKEYAAALDKSVLDTNKSVRSNGKLAVLIAAIATLIALASYFKKDSKVLEIKNPSQIDTGLLPTIQKLKIVLGSIDSFFHNMTIVDSSESD